MKRQLPSQSHCLWGQGFLGARGGGKDGVAQRHIKLLPPRMGWKEPTLRRMSLADLLPKAHLSYVLGHCQSQSPSIQGLEEDGQLVLSSEQKKNK